MQPTVASFVFRKDDVTVNAPRTDLPLPNTLMGIEVEIDNDGSHDGCTFPVNYSPEWQRKGDGSLANGWEYVLTAPLKGQTLVDAVYKLYSEPTQVYRTYTGSTHIHINMMDGVSTDALRALVLISYAFESLLYYVGDNTRQWCGYASRLTSSPAEVLESIISDTTGHAFQNAVSSAGRYYGLNLNALHRYGSVEFRYFPTAESPEELLGWIKLVQNFKRAAVEIGGIEPLIATLNNKEGYNSFISEYFPDHLEAVQASCEYSKVKALMGKALIIATAARPDKKINWSRVKLQSHFKKLMATKKPGKVPKFLLHFMRANRGAPTCGLQRQADIVAAGEDSVTLLAYAGALYYAAKSTWAPERYDWHSLSDAYEYHPEMSETIIALEAGIRTAIDSETTLTSPQKAVLVDRLNAAINYLNQRVGGPTTIHSDDPEPEEFDEPIDEDYDEDEDN